MCREKLEKLIVKEVYNNSWSTYFNRLEQDHLGDVLDVICNHLNVVETLQNSRIDIIYELMNNIDKHRKKARRNVYLLNTEEWKQEAIELMKRKSKMSALIIEFWKEQIEFKNKFIKEIADLQNVRESKMDHYLEKQWNKSMRNRITLMDKKIETVVRSFITSPSWKDRILEEEYNLLQSKEDRMFNFYLEFAEFNNDDEKQQKIKKIFDYKEMVKLAEQNNYYQARVNGDHAIFLHKVTNKIVPIPKHSLGYGLMCKIQKQIYQNKIA